MECYVMPQLLTGVASVWDAWDGTPWESCKSYTQMFEQDLSLPLQQVAAECGQPAMTPFPRQFYRASLYNNRNNLYICFAIMIRLSYVRRKSTAAAAKQPLCCTENNVCNARHCHTLCCVLESLLQLRTGHTGADAQHNETSCQCTC